MSNIVTFNDLYGTEFNVRFFNSAKQYWNNRYTFSCLDTPKQNDMLLFLCGCSGEYTLPCGSVLYAPKGSIVYAPLGARYSFRPMEIAENGDPCTYIVNFTMSLENGESLVLSENVLIMEGLSGAKYEMLFSSLATASVQNVRFPARLKAGLYSILSELCTHFHKQNILSSHFQVISDGILYLEENEELSLSISDIARMCNVSEIYFRKLFKEYSGRTPTEFKIERKIERAKQYLAFDGKSVSSTAELLGFTETAYFCRLFKEKTGMTPKGYLEYVKGEKMPGKS